MISDPLTALPVCLTCLAVTPTHPQVIYPSVTDRGNGSHTVAYSPGLNGMYNVTAELARPGGLTAAFYSDR